MNQFKRTSFLLACLLSIGGCNTTSSDSQDGGSDKQLTGVLEFQAVAQTALSCVANLPLCLIGGMVATPAVIIGLDSAADDYNNARIKRGVDQINTWAHRVNHAGVPAYYVVGGVEDTGFGHNAKFQVAFPVPQEVYDPAWVARVVNDAVGVKCEMRRASIRDADCSTAVGLVGPSMYSAVTRSLLSGNVNALELADGKFGKEIPYGPRAGAIANDFDELLKELTEEIEAKGGQDITEADLQEVLGKFLEKIKQLVKKHAENNEVSEQVIWNTLCGHYFADFGNRINVDQWVRELSGVTWEDMDQTGNGAVPPGSVAERAHNMMMNMVSPFCMAAGE